MPGDVVDLGSATELDDFDHHSLRKAKTRQANRAG
jgi:hypothetical protein